MDKKIIFLSWSGERSRAMAEFLRTWLSCIIQTADPWMSSEDIEKGTRWEEETSTKLEEACFGIICLTRQNLNRPWILFEAGALSKKVQKTHVSPFLIDLKPADITRPLAQFQATEPTRDDCRKLLLSINQSLDRNKIANETLERSFEKFWPEFEEEMKRLPPEKQPKVERKERDILEEILMTVRDLVKYQPVFLENGPLGLASGRRTLMERGALEKLLVPTGPPTLTNALAGEWERKKKE